MLINGSFKPGFAIVKIFTGQANPPVGPIRRDKLRLSGLTLARKRFISPWRDKIWVI